MFGLFVLAPPDVLDGRHTDAGQLRNGRNAAVDLGQLVDVFAEIVVRRIHVLILYGAGQSSSGIDDLAGSGIILAFCFLGTKEGAMPQILKDGSIRFVKRERDAIEGAADVFRTIDHIWPPCGAAAELCDDLLDGKIRKEVKDDGQESSQG